MMKQRYAWVTLIGLVSIQAFRTTLEAGQGSSTARLVAEVSQRIETGKLGIRVYIGKKPIQLGRFMELLVVTPRDGSHETIENLVRRSVAIVQSEKTPDRWEIYGDVWAGTGNENTLADNVFMVKQVLISSRRHPVELRLDGQVIQLMSGDALLVI